MYQAVYPPHLYLPQSISSMLGNDMYLGDINRMSNNGLYYSGEGLHNTERDMVRERMPPPLHAYPRFGSRKSSYWVSKRTLRGSQASPNSGTLESESDDSSLSTNSSSSSIQGLKAKRLHNLVPFRFNYNYPQRLVEEGGPLQQPSLLFHNKRRFNRIAPRGRRSPSEPWQVTHLQQFYAPHIAPDRFLMKSHLMQVLDNPPNLKSGSKWDNLSLEIWNKFLISQQTEDTFRKKITLWRFLYISIKNMYPRYGIYLVGSTISGFGANNSDVDLCLSVKSQESQDNRMQALNHLEMILKLIRNIDAFSNAELIKAKVPILKFRDNCLSLEIDLNCNNTVGIRNTHLLYCYSQLDWRVRPLVLIVKLWAQHHNINDAKNKTISSYSLVLMVLHYLQCGTSPSVLPCLQSDLPNKFNANLDIHQIDLLEQMPPYNSKNNETIGELLYGFLKYYTNFQYNQYAVSVRTGTLLSVDKCRATRIHEPHQWKLLCVEEPFNLSNTARSVYDTDVFTHICRVFEKTTRKLEAFPSLASLMPS